MEAIEFMKQVDSQAVDLVLCDLPYEVTQNDWDKKLNLKDFFQECWRVLKEDGTIVLTSQQPFTTALINAEPKHFRYELIWDKVRTSGFLNANRMPLRSHENILVFYKKLGIFNPQFIEGDKSHSKGKMSTDVNNNYGDYGKIDNTEVHGNKKFPKSIQAFIKPHPPIHPTQKPVELFEWLVKTYSNEGDLVLDCTIGVGTTAIACKRTNRNFIGNDLNQEFVKIANQQLEQGTLNAFSNTQNPTDFGFPSENSLNMRDEENPNGFSQILKMSNSREVEGSSATESIPSGYTTSGSSPMPDIFKTSHHANIKPPKNYAKTQNEEPKNQKNKEVIK